MDSGLIGLKATLKILLLSNRGAMETLSLSPSAKTFFMAADIHSFLTLGNFERSDLDAMLAEHNVADQTVIEEILVVYSMGCAKLQ